MHCMHLAVGFHGAITGVGLGCGPFVVQGEQAGQDIFFLEVGGPSVGGKDGLVQGAVSVGEPLRTLVVEIGEGAFGKVARVDVWRVEPGVAEADE